MTTGRPPLALGTHGEITTKSLPNGSVQAGAYFRGHDGRTVRVRRAGATVGEAKRRLRAELAARAAGGGSSSSSITLRDAVNEWMTVLERRGSSPSTRRVYASNVTKVMAACGDLRLNEITTRVLGAHLRPFEDATPEQARIARVVIRAALSYAVRQGHLTTNPARELEPIRSRTRAPRALTRDEAHRLRALAIEQTALVTDDGVRFDGPTPIGDLELVIVLGLACGARVGELLALRWDDLDLDGPVPTVEIGATLVRHPGQPVTRQEHTKTHSSRLIPLADGAVAALRNRAATGTDTVRVFSLDGRWLDPTVLRRRWNRMLEGTDLHWCTPHTLRRTAATWVRAARSTEAAAELLGHTSVLITERSYLQRARVTGDHREVLDLD